MESYELRFSPWFLCTLEEMEHDADLPTIHAAVDRMFRNHEIALQCILLQQKGDLNWRLSLGALPHATHGAPPPDAVVLAPPPHEARADLGPVGQSVKLTRATCKK